MVGCIWPGFVLLQVSNYWYPLTINAPSSKQHYNGQYLMKYGDFNIQGHSQIYRIQFQSLGSQFATVLYAVNLCTIRCILHSVWDKIKKTT